MEETPEPAESQPVTPDDRAPLGVRVIAGFLLVSGACTLLDLVLDLWTGGGVTLSFGLGALPLGWGLLRRREWARVWTTCISAFWLLGCILGLVLFAAISASGKGRFAYYLDGLPWWINYLVVIVGLSAALATLLWSIRTLTTDRVIRWFHQAPRMAFIEWNPKRWRFGIGTLLFLTFLVAFTTASVMVHPAIRAKQAQWWAETQDLNDAIYFPLGAKSLPQPGRMSYTSRSNKDGSGCSLQYVVTDGGIGDARRQLAYVAMDRWSDEKERLQTGTKSGLSKDEWKLIFKTVDTEEFTFSGTVQILECYGGKVRTSDMHITLLEFWSFHEHPDAVWTLEGLEAYVKDLRKRVAERDATP